MEIRVRNVNHAFSEVFWRLKALAQDGQLPVEQTRNGAVVAFPEPVMTIYERPAERVLFHAGRDANPIFHLMEAIWMLAGRNDVAFLDQFNSTIKQFSDDGLSFNAAYGYRWRRSYGFDQLEQVIGMLQDDPTSRQAVLQMWSVRDLSWPSKDKACNMSAVFDCRRGRLNMTVFNRSNDIWWGAYGANAVHFSVLQEFVALALGLPLGEYRQVSNNLHLYLDLYPAAKHIDIPPEPEDYDYYTSEDFGVLPRPLFRGRDWREFLRDCEYFCQDPYSVSTFYQHAFFNGVAVPMANVSRVRREKSSRGGEYVAQIRAEDWRRAVAEWVERRELAKVK
jgi:hypothetical protein